MYRLLVVMLCILSFNLAANEAAPSAPGGSHAPVTNPDAETRQNMALVGGALIGMIGASGVVGIISAATMTLEGAGIVEALEAGAGLTMPLAILSGILGAMFTNEFVLQQINAFNVPSAHKAPSH